MSRRARSVLALAAVALLSLALAAAAQARRTRSSRATSRPSSAQDGSVSVVERITVSFDGSYTFGFREMPYPLGRAHRRHLVSENGSAFRPGAPTELEPGGPPGTFGVRDLGGRVRVVWRFESDGFGQDANVHASATGISGLAVAYDDVVDVNLKVWGDEWEQPLGRLTATMRGPGDVVRAWGHPVWVRGDVTLQGRAGAAAGARRRRRASSSSCARSIPRDAFTSTAGMQVEEGAGLQKIIAEEAADAADYDRDQRADRRRDRAARGAGCSSSCCSGRSRPSWSAASSSGSTAASSSTGYDREYEQEPPTETAAGARPDAAAAGWRGRLVRVHGDALRPRSAAASTTPSRSSTERSRSGAASARERVSDLELSPGNHGRALTPWETSVTRVVDDVLDGRHRGASPAFRDEIEAERERDVARGSRRSRRTSAAR